MFNKKEKWESLRMEIIPFTCEDIITTSNTDEWLDEELDGEWGD